MKRLLLCCSPEYAPPPGYLTVYWAQYVSEIAGEEEGGNISLPETIHKNADYWKPRYLAWLDSVGKKMCGPKSVVETLVIRPGLSYWWMTIPSDYSFSSTSIAYSTLRLWALTQIADDNEVEEICVVGADAALEDVLKLWCSRTGRHITFMRGQMASKYISQDETISSRLKRSVPPLVKGLGYLALEYIRYYSRHRGREPSGFSHDPELTIVDYFVNFDVDAASEATYTSNYWGPLGSILRQRGTTVNWIHIDTRSATVPSVRSARISIKNLNRGDSFSHHTLIQDYLTLRVVFKTAKQYWRLHRTTKPVIAQLQWLDAASGIDVRPLVDSRLRLDLQGVGAAKNLLLLSLFEEALPSQAALGACVYLMENQPWELGLLQARAAQGSGPNIGVAHTTVRNWDLQCALGSFPGDNLKSPSLPAPSRVAVIDPQSEAIMLANGYETSTLVKVEALRFLSLMSTTTEASNKRNQTATKRRLLICGEYDPLVCTRQLQLLKKIVPLIRDNYDLIFRSHPGNSIGQESLPTGVALSEAHTIGEELAKCHVVLCSNVSSVSLDANLQEIPILMLRDGRGFDGSLFGASPRMRYVANASDVTALLREPKFVGVSGLPDPIYPMYLDNGLTKWRDLLDSVLGDGNH
jgi:surface carbohydrate biosynthesis protein (TIGR04326 family)